MTAQTAIRRLVSKEILFGVPSPDRPYHRHWAVSLWLALYLLDNGELVSSDDKGNLIWARRFCYGRQLIEDRVLIVISEEYNAS